MTAGIKIYDALGNVVLDGTSRPPKLLGVVERITTAGSITVQKPDSTNTIWFYVQATQRYEAGRGIPIVSISGNVISWSFLPSIFGSPATTNLFYGVY